MPLDMFPYTKATEYHLHFQWLELLILLCFIVFLTSLSSQHVSGDKWEYDSFPILIVDFGPVLNTNVN